MMAYFDSTGTLRRFDSMGGASGLFFLEEKGAFATVNKFEAKIELTPESSAEIEKLQEQLDAEIIENLKMQICAVDAVRKSIECCNANENNCFECPYSGKGCTDELLKDALAIAEAYRRVLASGLEMMEKK